MGNKTFDFCCPKTTKFGIFVHFGPGLAGSFCWWLWRAGCISQDTYLLYYNVVANTAVLNVCTKYIYSIHTEYDLRPSAVEDCHDRSSKSNAAGQSTTGACVTLEGAARPDLGCSSCKRERETAFKPSHLPSQSHNTHNTHNTQREYSQYSHAQSLKS